MANEGREGRLVTGAAARDDADLRSGILRVYDLVLDVAAHGGIGVWDAEQRCVDEVGRIMDKVLCCVVLAIQFFCNDFRVVCTRHCIVQQHQLTCFLCQLKWQAHKAAQGVRSSEERGDVFNSSIVKALDYMT